MSLLGTVTAMFIPNYHHCKITLNFKSIPRQLQGLNHTSRGIEDLGFSYDSTYNSVVTVGRSFDTPMASVSSTKK